MNTRTITQAPGNPDGSHLSTLERDILSRIDVGFDMALPTQVDWAKDTRTSNEKAAEWTCALLRTPSALIVWIDEDGLHQMGAVRGRRPAGYGGRRQDMLDASPFPGAWCEVPINRVLIVRHPETI